MLISILAEQKKLGNKGKWWLLFTNRNTCHGSVPICCTLNKIREIHNPPDGFKTMFVCRQCHYPRKAIPDERAIVKERETLIENYVNREQKIGGYL